MSRAYLPPNKGGDGMEVFWWGLVSFLWLAVVLAFSGCIPQRQLLPSSIGALETCREDYAFTDKVDEQIQSMCPDEACRIPWRQLRNQHLAGVDHRCADVLSGVEVIHGKSR